MRLTYMPPLALPERLTSISLAPVYPIFVLLVFSMIFLQKFGYTTPDGSSIGLDTPLIWVGLGWLIFRKKVEVSGTRLLLFGLLINAIAISLVAGSNQNPKLQAVAIVLALYGPL